MTRRRVLLLAGTAEAAELAHLLVTRAGVDVVASFAGPTSEVSPLPCPVRRGGFGGVEGLVQELRSGGYSALIDATHPFAAVMPHHAAAAAEQAGMPRLRLVRPAWPAEPQWLDAEDLVDAANQLTEIGARRVLLTTGRNVLQPFAALTGVHFVVRSIEPPDPLPLADAVSITARPPFTLADERALLESHRIDTLVTKNSGGANAKLVAAREAGVRIVMIRRPRPVAGPVVSSAAEAFEWTCRWTGD